MPNNKSFWISTAPPTGWMDELYERIRVKQERQFTKMLVDVPKYEISTIDLSSIYQPDITCYNYKIKPFSMVKLEKETNKMEAKKCDRCGKLYEKKFDKNDIQCVFKFEDVYITEEEKKKKYSKEIIEDKKTHPIYIRRIGDDIDLCPECRESFKKWFEG